MNDAGLRLLCVLAHPDDEALGFGGILARAAAEGVATFLATATRGERGRIGGERPGAAVAGPVRERELRCAAAVLGVAELALLGYHDGDVARAEPWSATSKIAALIRRWRPQVVATFGAEGGYGHPDHVAISQLTSAAILAAVDPAFVAAPEVELPAAPHRVAKLYWLAWTEAVWRAYQSVFGEAAFRVDGGVRRAAPWPDWAVTTWIDTRAYRETVWRAIRCHESQVAGAPARAEPWRELEATAWDAQPLYRVFSLVETGPAPETDLFAGLRS